MQTVSQTSKEVKLHSLIMVLRGNRHLLVNYNVEQFLQLTKKEQILALKNAASDKDPFIEALKMQGFNVEQELAGEKSPLNIIDDFAEMAASAFLGLVGCGSQTAEQTDE